MRNAISYSIAVIAFFALASMASVPGDYKFELKKAKEMFMHMDMDKNGRVDKQEMKQWLHTVQNEVSHEQTVDMWREFFTDKVRDGPKLRWDKFKARFFENVPDDDHHLMATRRRWAAADHDNDDQLTLVEFHAFKHPRETSTMFNYLGWLKLIENDRNSDGFLDEDEFLETKSDRPRMRELMKKADTNGDGKLSASELEGLFISRELQLDEMETEAQRLMNKFDLNKDQELDLNEIKADPHGFIRTSPAIDFARIHGRHDEL